MADDIATLGLAVDSTQLATASQALDTFAAKGAQAEQASSRFETAAERMARQIASMTSATRDINAGLEALRVNAGPLAATQQMDQMSKSFAAAGITQRDLTLARQAETIATKDMTGAHQFARDTVDRLVTSQEHMHITMREGREIIMATTEAVRGNFTVAILEGGRALASFVGIGALMTTVGAAVLLVGGAVVTAALAWRRWSADLDSINVVLLGVAQGSGLTADAILGIGRAIAASGGVTENEGRKIAIALAGISGLSRTVMQQIGSDGEAFGKIMGVDATKGAEALAKAVVAPIAGMAKLDETLQILDPTFKQHIKDLVDSGNLSEAQAALSDRATQALGRVKPVLEEQVTLWKQIGTVIGNAYDNLGKILALGGGPAATSVQRITSLTTAYNSTVPANGAGFDNVTAMRQGQAELIAREREDQAIGQANRDAAVASDELTEAMRKQILVASDVADKFDTQFASTHRLMSEQTALANGLDAIAAKMTVPGADVAALTALLEHLSTAFADVTQKMADLRSPAQSFADAAAAARTITSGAIGVDAVATGLIASRTAAIKGQTTIGGTFGISLPAADQNALRGDAAAAGADALAKTVDLQKLRLPLEEAVAAAVSKGAAAQAAAANALTLFDKAATVSVPAAKAISESHGNITKAVEILDGTVAGAGKTLKIYAAGLNSLDLTKFSAEFAKELRDMGLATQGALDVATSSDVSTAAQLRAAAAAQAHTEAMTKAGISEKVLSQAILDRNAAQGAASFDQQLPALSQEVDGLNRVADAEKIGTAAAQQAAEQNKVMADTATLRALAETTGNAQIKATIDDLIAKYGHLADAKDLAARRGTAEATLTSQRTEISLLDEEIRLVGTKGSAAQRDGEIELAHYKAVIQAQQQFGEGLDAERQKFIDNSDLIARKTAELNYYNDIRTTAQGYSNDVKNFLLDGLTGVSNGGKSIFKNLWDTALQGGKRLIANLALSFAEQQFLMPIVTQVVGSAPGVFGISTPSSLSGGASGLLGQGSSLLSLGNSTGLINTGGMFGGNGLLSANSLDQFGLSHLGIGTLSGSGVSAIQGGGVAFNDIGLGGALSGQSALDAIQGGGVAFNDIGAGGAVSGGGVSGGLSGLLGGAATVGGGLFGIYGGISGLASGNLNTLGTAASIGEIGAGGVATAAGAASLGLLGGGMEGLAALGPYGLAAAAVLALVSSFLGQKKPHNISGVVGQPLNADGSLAATGGEIGNDNGANTDSLSQILSTSIQPFTKSIASQYGLSLAGNTAVGLGSHQTQGKDDFTMGLFSEGSLGHVDLGNIDSKDPTSLANALARLSLVMIRQSDTVNNVDVKTAALNTDLGATADVINKNISFAASYQDNLKALSTGQADLTKTIAASAQANAAQILQQIRDFKQQASDLGLDTEAAAKATKDLVDVMIGVKDAAAPLSAVQQALASTNAGFDALTPVLLEVGYSADQAAQKISDAKAKALTTAQAGFVTDLASQAYTDEGLGVVNDLGAAKAAHQQNVATASTLQMDATVPNQAFNTHVLALIQQAGTGANADFALNAILGAFNSSSAEDKFIQGAVASQKAANAMTAAAASITGAGSSLSAAAQAQQQAAAALQSLARFTDSLSVGQLSPMLPGQQLDAARGIFNSDLGLAQAGDGTAISALQGDATQLLTIGRSFFGGATEGYAKLFNEVTGALRSLTSAANNPVVTAVNSTTAAVTDGTQAVVAAIAAGQAAGNTASGLFQGLRNSGSLSGFSADQLNTFQNALNPPANDNSPAGLFDTLRASGGLSGFSQDQLDTFAGHLQHFAGGGDFMGGLRIVGERGPELEATGAARYLSNDALSRMLSGANDNGSVAVVQAINTMHAGLHARLSSVEDHLAGLRDDTQQANTDRRQGHKNLTAAVKGERSPEAFRRTGTKR